MDAFDLCRDKNLNLVYVGDGQDQDLLKNKVQQKGLEKRVHFVGFQKNAIPYIKSAEANILPSYHEAFPYSCQEAAALGVLSIVSNYPAVEEIYEPKYILKNQKGKGLVEELQKAIDNLSVLQKNIRIEEIKNTAQEYVNFI